MTTPEIIDQIHKLIFEDGRISAKSIAEQLDISRERFGSVIHEDLNMRKLSAKWIPKCLNADHKLQLCHSSEHICNFFGANKIISCRTRLVSMGETWIYHYDPETKQQSKEWRHSSYPALPQKIPSEKSGGKFLASIFCDQVDIILIDHIPKGHTINSEYYSSQLEQLKDILKEKPRGKFNKVVLFLHDNTPVHRALGAQKKLAYLGFQ